LPKLPQPTLPTVNGAGSLAGLVHQTWSVEKKDTATTETPVRDAKEQSDAEGQGEGEGEGEGQEGQEEYAAVGVSEWLDFASTRKSAGARTQCALLFIVPIPILLVLLYLN